MLEPWVAWSALLPAVCLVYLCMNVGLRGATPCSACPALRHSESSPLGLSVCECRAVGLQGLLVVRLPGPFVPHSASLSPPQQHESSPPSCPSLPLLPVWMNVYFLSPWCRTSLSFDFLSFWLCKEAQCVYLRHHLGSPLLLFSKEFCHQSAKIG